MAVSSGTCRSECCPPVYCRSTDNKTSPTSLNIRLATSKHLLYMQTLVPLSASYVFVLAVYIPRFKTKVGTAK
jgi:hypothetical protein